MNSSHDLMENKPEARKATQGLRNIRNSKYGHASTMNSEVLDEVCETIRDFVALCLPLELERCIQKLAAACAHRWRQDRLELVTYMEEEAGSRNSSTRAAAPADPEASHLLARPVLPLDML